MQLLKRYLPILTWGADYTRQTFTNDLVVACIVTIMLIPQSLAYALLAGLPMQVGLYASMAPLILYALFGTSRSLAVGPVAVASLMTAAALVNVASPGSPEYLTAAIALATISGLILLVMGFLRLGFMANFLSHPVISGFITASGLQIAAGQFAPVLGISAHGENFVAIMQSMLPNLVNINPYTAAVGIFSLVFLFWVRKGLKPLMCRIGLNERAADLVAKIGPVIALVLTTVATWYFSFADHGVSIVGTVPQGLPSLVVPSFDAPLWTALIVPALLISIVGYVESVSVALTLAAKKRQRIDPDQELIALGAANIGSGLSGGFPVTGGLSRSVVNFDAGAETPAAGAFTAVGIALAALFLTPFLFFLPKATLAAIIIVAVTSLIDFGALKHTWRYSRADGLAMVATIVMTLIEGVEMGLIAGVGVSIFLHLYKTSKPHVAVVGQLPGTMSFRNVQRHKVVTSPDIISLRIDASFYFPNARFIEDTINNAVASNPQVKHVVLECPAVNTIDATALESLLEINHRLKDGGIALHLSEVKGPIMDLLQNSNLIESLTGKVHLTQFDAISSINPELAQRTLAAKSE